MAFGDHRSFGCLWFRVQGGCFGDVGTALCLRGLQSERVLRDSRTTSQLRKGKRSQRMIIWGVERKDGDEG